MADLDLEQYEELLKKQEAEKVLQKENEVIK